MNWFIDINNREQLSNLLLTLNDNAKPLWGKMKPQQMVEHLVVSIEYTNGKKIVGCDKMDEEAKKNKEAMIYSDVEMPKNVFLEKLPKTFKYANIETTVMQLIKELDDFDQYFKEQGTITIHPGFGPMNHQEWLIWHGKHFTHHLKQFGLLPAKNN